MTNPLTMKSWSPYVVGVGIGVLTWFAFATADHPLGVSTAFEHTAALAEKAAVPQAEQTNEYFAKKAEEGKPPKIGWEWMVVLGVFLGALLSSWLSGDRTAEAVPAMWRERFGGSVVLRLTAAFLAGLLMMFGARLAGGLHERPRHQRQLATGGVEPRLHRRLLRRRDHHLAGPLRAEGVEPCLIHPNASCSAC